MAYRTSSSASGNTNSLAPASTGVQDGDKVFLFWHQGGAAGATITWPSGFVELDDIASTGNTTKVATKTATASEPSTYAISTSVGDYCVAIMLALSGRDTGAVLSPVQTIDETPRTLPASTPLTGVTAQDGDDIVWFAANIPVFGNIGAWTPPTDYTERQDVQAAFYISASVATRDNVSAGATGTLTGTQGAGDDAGYAGFVIRVPAASASESYILDAGQGSYVLTGQAATLLAGGFISAESGSYTLLGSDALRDMEMDAVAGDYDLTGQDADLLGTAILSAEFGSYDLIGQAAAIIYSTAASIATPKGQRRFFGFRLNR